MNRYNKLFVIIVGMVLVACEGTSLSHEQSVAIMCRGYAVTVAVLAPYKQEMTYDQVATVNAGIMVLSPLCQRAAQGEMTDYEQGARALRDELRLLLVVEKAMTS